MEAGGDHFPLLLRVYIALHSDEQDAVMFNGFTGEHLTASC
jgi:hypothetical protein